MRALIEVLGTVNTRLGNVPLYPIRVLIAGQNGVDPLPDGLISRILGRGSKDWRELEHTIIVCPSLLDGDPEELEASIWHAVVGLADRQADDPSFYESLSELGNALPELSGEEEDNHEPLMGRVREYFAQAMTGAEVKLTAGDHDWPLTGWSAELIRRMHSALKTDDEDE